MVSYQLTKKILCIDTDYDDVVKSFKEGREPVYTYFEEKGFQCVFAQGKDANRNNVSKLAMDDEVVYITGSGHGSDASFQGHKGHDLFKKKKKGWFSRKGYLEKEVEGKIVHFLSCNSAKILGIDFVDKGCKAFLGYDEVVQLDPDYNPIYSVCDSAIDYAIADGKTALEAYESAVQFYKDTIRVLNARNSEYLTFGLKKNLERLKGPSISPWGTRNAKIPSEEKNL